MEIGLNGKIAIVSGASRGIGRGCALELAREGCDLLLVARDAVLLADTRSAVEAIGRRAETQTCDLRDATAPAAVVQTALDRFGRVDIVVNSAGATKRGDFFGLTDADFDDGFALKFMGAVRLTREAWPHLAKTKGSIVNIIGMGGRMPEPDFTIGGPVNAALMNFTKAMSIRGVRDGVRVTGINPGLIETDRIRRRMEIHATSQGVTLEAARRALLDEHHIDRLGRPEEIGKLVCYLAGTPGAFMQGSLIGIDGGGFHGM